jgi:hypothetical protein
MRNISKTTTLESRFPLLANNCIISKGRRSYGLFRVRLPEIFTVGTDVYESIHSSWSKAIKTLPDYSILHKQDWYLKAIPTGPEKMNIVFVAFLPAAF